MRGGAGFSRIHFRGLFVVRIDMVEGGGGENVGDGLGRGEGLV